MAREKYSGSVFASWSRPKSSGAWAAEKRKTSTAVKGKTVE